MVQWLAGNGGLVTQLANDRSTAVVAATANGTLASPRFSPPPRHGRPLRSWGRATLPTMPSARSAPAPAPADPCADPTLGPTSLANLVSASVRAHGDALWVGLTCTRRVSGHAPARPRRHGVLDAGSALSVPWPRRGLHPHPKPHARGAVRLHATATGAAIDPTMATGETAGPNTKSQPPLHIDCHLNRRCVVATDPQDGRSVYRTAARDGCRGVAGNVSLAQRGGTVPLFFFLSFFFSRH